jgi:hypothetical protein
VPKGLIPDPLSATVHIGARWRAGSLSALDGRPLPEIQDGTLIELILPAWAVTNDKEREELRSRRTLDMLPKDAKVFLGLSSRTVPAEYRKKFIHLEKAVGAASYLLAEVVLIDPLGLAIDGSQRATLELCRCKISLLNIEATSLNHAFTMLSQAFEPERISHGGNVFRKGFILRNGGWVSLDDLRFAKVEEFLRNISETAQPGLL